MLDSLVDPLVLIGLLLVSVVIHENAHAVVALALGDTTAKDAGRITLNPVKHLDIVGSLILPAFLAFTTGMVFGYAKPVPINHHLLRGKDRGFAIVALAGPAANMALAFIGVLVLQRVTPAWPAADTLRAFGPMFVSLNIFLAAFNLMPIPPLDGSRLLRVALPPNGVRVLDKVEPYGFLILLVLIVWLNEPFFRILTMVAAVLARILPG